MQKIIFIVSVMIQKVFLRFLFCLFAFCISAFYSKAQSTGTLSNIRAEELTDDQVRGFQLEINRLGLSDEQLQDLLVSRGMPVTEFVKLRIRIQALRSAALTSSSTPGNTPTDRRRGDSLITANSNPVYDYNNLIKWIKPGNYGFDVFSNNKLTFQPDLRIPTPLNYRLAAGDELLIDVSGLSEASYRLFVSPEGIVRIPLAGPVFVNGLTIEEARRLIVKKLSSTIYTAISSGNTKVDIALGTIRSIKVTIIGEAVLPGSFTLPSLATAFHALYACGGANNNGSLRDIQVIRNNETIATIDVYEFLQNGSKRNDVRLMDQDVIKINHYNKRIELKGEVKRPGFYDIIAGESFTELINYAGGFTDAAYKEKVQVFKNTSKERKITTLDQSQFSSAIPDAGDVYIIGKILNRFTNRISIRGAVYRPGDYELKPGITLKQLIQEADGLREDAFTGRGNIHRIKKDMRPEIISFDLEQIINDRQKDIELQAEDRIIIFSTFDINEGYYLIIDGEIASPGVYLYEEGMRVQDIILMAGGLKESASRKRIEIARRIKTTDSSSASSKVAVIFQQDVSSDLRDTSLIHFVLQPFDEITVRTAPGYSIQKNVVIEGEVVYTGKYALETKTQRISDLINRSGGLTKDAYLQGAVLVRTRMLSRTEQSNNELGFQNLIKQNILSGTPAFLLQNQVLTSINQRSQFVGIDLAKIMEQPGSKYDLLLMEGDTLRIPKRLQTVRINGEVLFPTMIRYDKTLSFRDYINRAGGFSERSLRRHTYAVRANGSVRGTKSFLFFKNYPSVMPGDEIYVPVKRERERLRTGEWITISATLISMMAIVITLLR